MDEDIRETMLYREATRLFESLFVPGTGQISDAADVNASIDDRHAAFTGTIVDALNGTPATRICEVELSSGHCHVVTFGPNNDRCPKYSPDGRLLAFLSDRHKEGDFQLYLLDRASGVIRVTPHVQGWVEYLYWSPDGRRVLLGVAGHGAEISGGQGGTIRTTESVNLLRWIPSVETGDEIYRWRRVWMYDLKADALVLVSPKNLNVWESCWCGDNVVAAVASPGPGEGLWYSARLYVVEVATRRAREVYVARDQLGWPAASPSGKFLAVVEALCSDRGIVAGELRLIETGAGTVRAMSTRGLDISSVHWQSETTLLLAGHRGFDTVIAQLDVTSGRVNEIWRSDEVTTRGFHATIAALKDPGECTLIGESFLRAPEIATIRKGMYRSVTSLGHGYQEHAKLRDVRAERLSWPSQDGLEIQGWLLRSDDNPGQPLVMNLHGGPVWHWHPSWLGRRHISILMLLKMGYAIFLPNPRGSSGRGRSFVHLVAGDLGGADAHDCLSGLDDLVARGIADPARLGVTGVSYGGFMTAWLTTQDSRFAAAVPLCPITNYVTEYLISNIPHFVSLFLGENYRTCVNKYLERSPIMHAHKVRTPTLSICGALDRCTPPAEAMQFHRALLENAVDSVLITYPEEGHGIRKLPAVIDCAARIAGWFAAHMPVVSRNSN